MHAPRRHLAVLPWVARLGRQIPAASIALMIGFAGILTVLVVQIGAGSAFVFLGAVWGATALVTGAKVAARGRGGRAPRSG